VRLGRRSEDDRSVTARDRSYGKKRRTHQSGIENLGSGSGSDKGSIFARSSSGVGTGAM